MDSNRLPVGDEQPDRVGHVQLALRVVALEPLERRPELLRREDVDPGVELAERTLLGTRIGRLDDTGQPTALVAHDPSVAASVGK